MFLWLFYFLLCKALWITIVYEMCYINKLALNNVINFIVFIYLFLWMYTNIQKYGISKIKKTNKQINK